MNNFLVLDYFIDSGAVFVGVFFISYFKSHNTMGKLKRYDITQYVSYNEDTDDSTCLKCGKIMKGKVVGNIKRHYIRMHDITIEANDNLYISYSSSVQQTNLQTQKRNNQISIKMDKSEFIVCCVGLVTIKNIPLGIFDDQQFFKKLMLPYEEKFKTNVNSREISDKINIISDKISQVISNSVNNKIICLKLDVISRLNENFLSVNIQYIKDFEVCDYTIGMIQLKNEHTAPFLKDEVLTCMEKFNIDITQLYSITTDNEANVLKTSKLLQDIQEGTQTFSNMETDNAENSESIAECEDVHDRLVAVLAVLRCATHTIQLAANDVLRTIEPNLEGCRKVIQALQVNTKDNNNMSVPKLDNIANWNSTFEMVKALSELRYFIDNSVDPLIIPDIDWNFIAEFIEAFQPLAECNKKFQCEQYIIGDFYRDWLCCEVELEDLLKKNTFAPDLLNAMNKRKQLLLKNSAFCSAIYLDPRFNFLNSPFLTEDVIKIAKNHLLKTCNNIKNVCDELQHSANDSEYDHNSKSSFTGMFSKLEKKVDSLICLRTPISTGKNIKKTLENFTYTERASFETNILEYWKNTFHRDTELRNLAQVALSVPTTQVSAKRAFRALSVILSNNKSKLSQETVNNILLVKLNSYILKEITLE